MAKVNMFKADRALSLRVADFMEFHMSRITDSKRHQKAIQAIEDTIKALHNCLGSALDEETTLAAIAAKQGEIEAENQRYKDACAKKAAWVWSVEDVAVYKAVVDDEDVEDKVCDWLNAWGLDVSGSENLVRDIVSNLGGRRFSTATKIVRSNAETWTSARTKADILKTLYGTVAEYMVKAGTLKPVQIPEDIRDAFAPKKKSAK